MPEMTALKFLKEYKRMCESQGFNCDGCEIYKRKKGALCRNWIKDNPEEAIFIVQKWAEENPEKTILQDFLEKYPDAELNSKGKPRFCPKNLGYKMSINCYKTNCFEKCWDAPLEVG